MKIGEVADFLELSSEALRYYEKNGIVTPRRGENGYREYDVWDFFNLVECKKYRNMNFSLDEIKSTMREESENDEIVRTIESKREELKAQIQSDTLLLDYLTEYQRIVETAPLNCGHYWYSMEPKIQYIVSWKNKDGEYYGLDLKSGFTRSWVNMQPFIRVMALFTEEDFQVKNRDFYCIEALDSSLVAPLGLPIEEGKVFTLPESLCLHTVVDAGNKGQLSIDLFDDAMIQLERDGMKADGYLRAEIRARQFREGRWQRYTELTIPCRKK